MADPYAALIGTALGVVRNRESEHERWRDGFEEAVFGTKGKVAAARDKARLELARQDALARVFGAHTNSLGMYEDQVARGTPAPQEKQGSSLAGLGPALQAAMGDGASGKPTSRVGESVQNPMDPSFVTDSDFFKHSGDYADIAAAETGGGGGGAGGGSGPSIIADSDIEGADWYKNAGRNPEALLNRRWHPDDERDPWRRL